MKIRQRAAGAMHRRRSPKVGRPARLGIAALFVVGLVVLIPVPASAASTGTFFPLPPARILDTRVGTGTNGSTSPVGPGQTLTFTVTGQGGVPATGVSAVVLNMTVVGATASSYLTVWPATEAMPTASNLNYSPGQTVPNLVTTKVGTNGAVKVFNEVGSVHVLADVAGWYKSVEDAFEGARYTPINPSRILDTRTGTGTGGATVPLGPGQTIDLQVTNRGGVPSGGVSAVAMNVTVVGPTAASYMTAWPTGDPQPNASNLNYVPGDIVPNLVIVKVGTDGKVSLFNESGSTHVLADVVGWYSSPSGFGSAYQPLNPDRILDTRLGIGAPTQPIGPGQTLNLQVTGRGGVPLSGVTGVAMNVTAVGPTTESYLTAWPSGATQPGASNLNYRSGSTVPNLVLVKVGTDGKVSLFNAFGSVHVIADVVGWFGVPVVPEVSRSMSVTAEHPHLFLPDTLVAPPGSKVTLTWTNPTDEVHTFTSPAINIDRAVDPASTITFDIVMPFVRTAFVCLIHQTEGMVGTLVPS